MLAQEKVEEIFKRQWALVKPLWKDGKIDADWDKCESEPWPGYAEAQRARRKILPHVSDGYFPKHLFEKRAPNQSELELEWMRENFEHTTLPVYLDLDNTVVRGLHETNWSQTIDDPDVDQYVTSGVREWGSLFTFIKHGLLARKIADPMGVVAFLPSEMDVEEVPKDDGTVTRKLVGELKAEPIVFSSSDVWGYDYDRWYLLRLPSCSQLDSDRKGKPTGAVCILVDDEAVWRIEQYGRAKEETFRVEVFYQHNVGEPPVIHMMGVPSVRHDRLVWKSPFSAAAGLLNAALLEEHQLRASKAKLMFPVVSLIGDPCDHFEPSKGARCVGGALRWFENDREVTTSCPVCKGSGRKSRLSPFGELVINANADSLANDNVKASDAVSFAAPPTQASEFVRAEVDRYISMARSIMHLDAERPMSGGDQKTATQAGLDAKARAAFVKPICDQLFTIYDFGVKCAGRMMKGKEWNSYSIRVPVEYDLRTDADFIDALSEMKKGELPPALRQIHVVEYIAGRYAEDPTTKNALIALMQVDRLNAMPESMKASEIASGRAKPWEVLLHFGGASIVAEVMQENDLSEKAVDEIAQLLVEKAKAKAPEGGDALRDLSEVINA